MLNNRKVYDTHSESYESEMLVSASEMFSSFPRMASGNLVVSDYNSNWDYYFSLPIFFQSYSRLGRITKSELLKLLQQDFLQGDARPITIIIIRSYTKYKIKK